MTDLQPHKHGDEGAGSTHAVCNKHNIGDKSVCCECSGKDDCSDIPSETNSRIVSETWEERLMDKFCVMFERAQDETVVERLESFISSLLVTERRRVLESVREIIEGMKKDEWDDILCGECKKPYGEKRNAENTIFNQALTDLLKELETI